MSEFTSFIRSLESDEPPSEARFESLLGSLGRVLRTEMGRRGLGTAPPSYLGLSGSRWNSDLFEELLLECYSFIFVDRLQGLGRRAKKGSIEGLIWTNVRHFLTDTQRRCDPIGARIFEITKAAVERALDQGSLVLGREGEPQGPAVAVAVVGSVGAEGSEVAGALSEDPAEEAEESGPPTRRKLRGESMLRLPRAADEVVSAPGEEVEPQHIDEDLARLWVEELSPPLLFSHRRGPVVKELAQRLAGLPIEAFRLRDLVEPLARSSRQHWKGLFYGGTKQGGGHPGEASDDLAGAEPSADPLALGGWNPGQLWEERQAARALLKCVEDGISALPQEKNRQYLLKIWNFLVERSAIWEEGSAVEDLPSASRLAQLLEIPRGRIPDLLSQLRARVVGCQKGVAKGSESQSEVDHEPNSPKALAAASTVSRRENSMDLQAKKDELRRRTLLESAAASDGHGGGREGGGAGIPLAGSVLPLDPEEPGVEWLIAGPAEQTPDCWVCVPLDSAPFLTDADLDLRAYTGEPLRARCALSALIPEARLVQQRVDWTLSDQGLQRVRERLEELAGSTDTTGPDRAQAPAEIPAEAPGHPSGLGDEAQEWLSRVRASGRRLIASAEGQACDEGAVSGTRLGPIAASADDESSTLGSGPEEAGEEAPKIRSLSSYRQAPRRSSWREAVGWGLAAALAAWAFGVHFQMRSLEQSLEEARRPYLVPTADAGEIRIGSDTRGLEVSVRRANRGAVLLYLVFRDVPERASYRVRVVEKVSGKVVLDSDAIEAVEHLLLLDLEALGIADSSAPVSYELQVLGVDRLGKEDVIETKSLKLGE